MVGPPSAADRDRNRRRLAVGLIGLVALSTALSGFYRGANLIELALLVTAGALVGGGLIVALRGRS